MLGIVLCTTLPVLFKFAGLKERFKKEIYETPKQRP